MKGFKTDVMSFLKKDLFIVSNWNDMVFIDCMKVKKFHWCCDGEKKFMTILCKAFKNMSMVFQNKI